MKKKAKFEQIYTKTVSLEGVAPTVERWTPNPTVAGSNPVGLIFVYSSILYHLLINT